MTKKQETVTVTIPPKKRATGDVVFVIPDFDAVLEERNRPRIPEGEYLGVVTGVAIHLKQETGNKSFRWSVTLNLGDFSEGWDTEAKTEDLFPDYYTPLGRDENGQFIPSKGIGITANMALALGYRDGQVNMTDSIGRLVLFTISHKADDRQTAEDIAADGVRWSAKVQRVRPYVNAKGVQAPKLDEALYTPTEYITVNGPTPAPSGVEF